MCPDSLDLDKITARESTMKTNRIGERGPLSHCLAFSKIVPNLPINIDSCVAPRYHLHQAVNNHRGKTLPKEHLPKEIPAQTIIRLLKVELEK
jgi:hypothetical protein